MSEPLISIIITNYNYSHFIEDAILSALNQDYPNKEVIVVDDGSTDNSISVIKKFEPQIALISKLNGGVSTARNVGVNYSRGDYLAFLDADDYWDEMKIRKQYERLVDADCELVYCNMKILDSSGIGQVTNEQREGCFHSLFLSNPGKTPFPPSSVLISRSLARMVGEWDASLINAAEDFDFFRRCSKYTEFAMIPEPFLTHREHPDSLTAGSLRRYYKYNSISMLKMYDDLDYQPSLIAIRFNIIRFQYSFAKSFLKKGDIYMSLLIFFLSIFPRTWLKKHSSNI